MSDTGREQALETAVSDLRKRFGDTAIMKLGEATHLDVDVIPTGSIGLDIALGVGGIPRGRVTEIYGPEMSGKTTICQHIIAEAQRMGGVAAFIDSEHALDPAYAGRCGVDVDNLYIAQPDTGEQALEIAEALVRSGEGEMGAAHMGLQARLMSQALRKLSGAIRASNAAMIFTNQLRQKIGVMFGNPETTSGGRALRFYASVRLDCRRIQAIKHKGEVVGSRTRVRVTKNKVAPPFRVVEFDIMYGSGLSREGDLLDLGVEMGLVDKRGSYYSFGEARLGQGRENAKSFLRDDRELAFTLENEILQTAGLPPRAATEEVVTTEPAA
jgi:recombination protein RecA